MDTSSSFQIMQCIDWILTGWPMIGYVFFASVICTLALGFVQLRRFMAAWRMLLFPAKKVDASKNEMSPLSAFINTLSTNMGNGSLTGGAMAVAIGGPGAAIWILVIGLLLMAVRFAEVYVSALYGANAPKNTVIGGPMLYLRDVFGGSLLSPLYAIVCFAYSLLAANMIQTHAMSLSMATTWGLDKYIAAVIFVIFIGYVVFGGASRIIAVSDRIVPVKVVVFFGSMLAIVGYHSGSLLEALKLMYTGAFTPEALIGGAVGYSVMQAVYWGMNLAVTATESGLGTAAILFGYTGSKDPMSSAVISMISTFVSSIVCFLVILCIVVSGVWTYDLKSAALTIAAFNTVFGSLGGWIFTFLSVSFGIGVLVAYAYIARAAWFYLTNGRYEWLFAVMYCIVAFTGAIIKVDLVWCLVGYGNGILLAINLFGILSLLPLIRRHMAREDRG